MLQTGESIRGVGKPLHDSTPSSRPSALMKGSLQSHHYVSDGVIRSLEDVINEGKQSLQQKNDPSKKNGVTYALFGSSGCGKSTLLRKIFVEKLYCNKDVLNSEEEYLTVFFTGSRHSDALKGLIDGKDDEGGDEGGCGNGSIVDGCGLDPDVYKWMYQMNYTFDKTFNFVVMIDDVLDVKSNPVMFNAFLTYRNMNITSVISLQYLKLCPLAVRSSVYFVFLMPANSREGVEQLVRNYMGMYLKGRNITEKMTAYELLTRDYRCFLLDNLNHKCYYVDNNYETLRLEPCFSDVKTDGEGEGEGEEDSDDLSDSSDDLTNDRGDRSSSSSSDDEFYDSFLYQ